MAQKATTKKSVADDPQYAQAVQNYEAGLRAMQEHKYEKAKGFLQKVLAGPNKELTDRANVHLSACNQHMERTATQFKSPEEHYDYAVSLMNVGDYVSAREGPGQARQGSARCRLCRLRPRRARLPTGHVEDSLRQLGEKPVRLNPTLRFQARNDSDFQIWWKIRASPNCFIQIPGPDLSTDANTEIAG